MIKSEAKVEKKNLDVALKELSKLQKAQNQASSVRSDAVLMTEYRANQLSL